MSTPFWDNSADAASNDVIGPGASGPLYVANEWDTAKLQGVHLPGLVQVLVPSKQRRLQNKKQNGTDGATPTFRGLDPAKVTIRVTIWTPDQLALWDALLPVIFPNPNKDVNKLSALDISHPATAQRGIKAIIIEDIDGPNNSSTAVGAKEYTLKCWEYLPAKAKSATKTPTGAVATTDAFKQTTATKNAPPAPSSTDFGPTPAPTLQQGSS